MVGFNARFGWPMWIVRTVVEVTVLIIGWLLGRIGKGKLDLGPQQRSQPLSHLRPIEARELLGSPGGCTSQPHGDLPDLLIFQQPAH